MEPQYLPKNRRVIDTQYRDHLVRIMEEGEFTQHPNQPVGRRVLLTLPPLVYNLENGIPLITERFMPFSKSLTPIAEMIAFIHGAHTAEEMEKRGVKWWKIWTTAEKCSIFGLPPGEMGPGSYGPGFHAPEFTWEKVEGHTDGGRWVPKPFNQFYHLIQEIKDRPFLSTHKISPWIPHHCLQHSELRRKVVVAPCHGDIQVTILGDKLTLTMTQRSGDYPVGVPADILMYAALTIMIAHVTGYTPHMLVHRVVDAHIYENQIPFVERMIWLGQEQKKDDVRITPFTFPTIHLTEEGQTVTNLFDFLPTHFRLEDYKHHPAIPEMPVTE